MHLTDIYFTGVHLTDVYLTDVYILSRYLIYRRTSYRCTFHRRTLHRHASHRRASYRRPFQRYIPYNLLISLVNISRSDFQNSSFRASGRWSLLPAAVGDESSRYQRWRSTSQPTSFFSLAKITGCASWAEDFMASFLLLPPLIS